MAKRRESVGTGITKRELTLYSGEDLGPFMKGFAKAWNTAVKEGGGHFGAVVLEAERACRRILSDAAVAPKRFEADTVEDYAERIVRHIELAKAAIAKGDADGAARWGVAIGRLCTEAEMKETWEVHALRGEKNALTVTAGALRENKRRQHEGEQRQAKWQAMADEMRAKNPHLTASVIARHIVDKGAGEGKKVHTIRKRIRLKYFFVSANLAMTASRAYPSPRNSSREGEVATCGNTSPDLKPPST
jgi:hypothetical protein